MSQVAIEGVGKGRAQLALDLHQLDLHGEDDDIDVGYRAWRAGGDTERARKERSELASSFSKSLPSLRARLRRGQHVFEAPAPRVLKSGRLVAALSVIDRIIVAALLAPFRRHPALKQILPCSYAYAPSKRGPKALVLQFLGAVGRAAACGASIEIAGYDINRCFPSLSAMRALFHARSLGFSRWRCDSLEALYRWWNLTPEFSGLTPGPSSSCFLAELALRPLDLRLAPLLSLFRYSDNLYLVGGGVPVREVMLKSLAAFNRAEELNLSLHHEQVTTYTTANGFSGEFEVLGFLFNGHEVLPHPYRVAKYRESVISAQTDTEAKQIIEGLTGYFAGVVPGGVLVRLQEELRGARSKSRRAGMNP